MRIQIDIPICRPIITSKIQLEIGKEYKYLLINGSNGAGKSTLFNLIVGVLQGNGKPNMILNLDKNYCPIEQKEFFRYLPQVTDDALFPLLSVEDNIKVLKEILNINKDFKKIVDIFKSDFNMDIAIGDLSVGQKKIFLMTMIILSIPETQGNSDPIILLLDEPFAGLDESNKQTMFDKIKKVAEEYDDKLKIIIVDHIHLKPAERGNRIRELEVRNKIIFKTTATEDISLKK